ncbi:hypothetical protein GPECTOR_565g595 [Gonium pectorale]|uniref:Uncharacterized protein n=1 Tax=Gonium pectorale TaxID=33097 RepID=A0A150FUN7_GONPE|nr:hypothetical protein GPECTOR_565g595 [Gonium pectorale]|eukprot:KXZ41306.1 hypothetical protein GPECTOR_565g595 [Gonium pectorale]
MVEKPADVVCDGDVCRRVTPEEGAAAKASAAPSGPGSVPPVFKLLGSTLLGQKGAEVPVSSITASLPLFRCQLLAGRI